MSKAIGGAAMIAADVGMAAALVLMPVASPLLAVAFNALAVPLLVGGLSMEAGAIADALVGQRGMNITTRQAAGARQIIYGQQRVGGTTIYQSTTGASGSPGNYVYNYIIAVATHEIDAFINLYLDGRRVFWRQGNQGSYAQYGANVGSGSVSNPPTTTVTIGAGAITGITASGGSGFANVAPATYRVKIDGDGTGAHAYATGGPSGWTVTVVNAGTGYTTATAEIQGAYTFGGVGAADEQDPSQPGYGLGFGIGPGGQHYNFNGKVYCEVRFGAQPMGDYMQSLEAMDYTWAQSGLSTQASGTATLNGSGGISSVSMSSDGFGYDGNATVSFTGGGGTGATGRPITQYGRITGVQILTIGTGYTSAPSVVFSAPAVSGTPSVMGCAYIYLNIGYAPDQFPQAPEIRITVNGKNDIYDPRTGKRGFTQNWALQVADVITDTTWGLGDPDVNQAQLIAAANVCDELVTTSQGSEVRYAQAIHYDTSTSPGDALSLMMSTAAGRLSYIGGEWYIWPAYWQGPSFSFDESALLDAPSWTPYRSFKDLINRVNGTYVAPNFPYNVSGNLYDSNGWYYGTTDNVWPFAWQPTNYPQYAADALHGYGSDIYLAEDGGVQLPKELALRGVISVVQAQRVAKITLMRNRRQGSGSFPMQLATWQMQPLDVFQFTFPALGWSNKQLEVSKLQFVCEAARGANGGGEGPPALSVLITAQETDIGVYEWSIGEELNPYDVLAAPGAISSTPAAPTVVSLADDTSTELMLGDGSTVPRLQVSWNQSTDDYVLTAGAVQVQWQDASGVLFGGAWVDAGSFTGSAEYCYVPGIKTVTNINARVRFVRPNGAASAWTQNTTSHIRPIGGPVTWKLGNGIMPYVQYPDGTAVEYWQPGEPGANVTETRVSLQTNNLTNHTLDNLGDGSTYARVISSRVVSGVPAYGTGQTIDALQPAQPGADVTSSNADVLLQNPNFLNGLSGWSPQAGWSLVTTLGWGLSSNSAQYTGMSTAAIGNNQKIPCVAGAVLSATAMVIGNATATGNAFVRLNFYNSSGVVIATTNGGVAVANVGWMQSRVVGAAPANTAYCQIDFAVFGEASGFWSVGGFTASIHANSIDEVPDGATYLRMPSANMDGNRRGLIDFTQGGHLNKTLDHIGDGTSYLRVPSTIYGAGGKAIDLGGNLKLKNLRSTPGSTSGPVVGTTWADLPELGSSNPVMTFSLAGNPILIGCELQFADISGGGVVTDIGVTFPTTTGSAPPGVGVTISGDGYGASATVSFTQSGSAPNFTWTPTINLTGGSHYSTASAAVTITSNGDPSYVNGTIVHACSVSAPTPVAGVQVQLRVLMDGVPIVGPLTAITDASGYIFWNSTQILFPSVGAHSFQVQAQNPSAQSPVSTVRTFMLVELG